MAEIGATRTEGEGGTYRHTWPNVTEADTCEPISIPGAPDATVQVLGTFGGTSVGMQGTCDALKTGTYAPLQDPQGNALAFTAAGIDVLASSIVSWLKPVLTGGSGIDITIVLLSRSAMR
jgi:hypothetical protein